VEIRRVYDEYLFVCGAAKIWAQLNDEGIRVGRCRVERLMREMGLVGNRLGSRLRLPR
jgi:putative transposase